MEKSEAGRGGKVLWFLVWGAMALVAAVNALTPYGVLSGRAGIAIGILLVGFAALLFAAGRPVLRDRREVELAWVALVLFGAGVFGQRVHMNPSGVDFSAYYVVGHLVAEHPPGRLYYQAAFPDGRFNVGDAASGWHEETLRYGTSDPPPFIYPPFFAVLMRPLAYFSYGVSSCVWSALTVLLTFASVWMIFWLGGRRISVELAVILLAGLFSCAPFFHELKVGQVASLLLFLFSFGICLLVRGQDWLSAFCFAVATMIKLTPVVVVPLLVIYRKWRWLAAYGCWVLALSAFSIWQAGWVAHEQFWREVFPSLSCGLDTYGNTSIMAFVQELFLGRIPMNGIPATLPTGACIVSKVVALGALAIMMLRFYRYRRDENLVLHLGLLLLLSLVISPIAWIHHYVIALFPFLYLWCREREADRDYLLLATVFAVGTSMTAFPLPLLVHSHTVQLVLAGIVPLLTLALVYFRVSGERLVGDSLEAA